MATLECKTKPANLSIKIFFQIQPLNPHQPTHTISILQKVAVVFDAVRLPLFDCLLQKLLKTFEYAD